MKKGTLEFTKTDYSTSDPIPNVEFKIFTEKSFRLWSVTKPYEQDIIESLENKYGELENKETLAQAILSVSKILAEDNFL